MTSKARRLTDLPVELLEAIAKSEYDDAFEFWNTLAFLCKRMNEVVTPLIYADLAFPHHLLKRAAQCCHHLAKNPRLAGLVQTIELGSSYKTCSPSEVSIASQLRADLVHSLPAMSSLRYLAYELDPGFNEEHCYALTHVSAKLEHLRVNLDPMPSGRVILGPVEQPATTAEQRATGRAKIDFPRLTALEVSRISLQEHITFFQEVLKSSSCRINFLSLSSDSSCVSSEAIMTPSMTFPCLKTIRVDWRFLGQIHASQTQKIRALTVFGDPPPSFDAVAFDDDAFPILEWLKCHHQALPHFMPPHPRTLRPIKGITVTTGATGDVADIKSLTPLCNSACGVETLTMVGDTFGTTDLHLSTDKPSMASLRHITIDARDFSSGAVRHLGSDLFALTTHLREIKLSHDGNHDCTAISSELDSYEIQLALLSEWGRVCRELVFVTFTSGSCWHKEIVNTRVYRWHLI